EIFSSSRIRVIRESSIHEKIILQSIVSAFKSSGLEEADFTEIVRVHRDLCRLEGFMKSMTIMLMEIAFNLYERLLILLNSTGNSTFLKSKIRLNVSTDDIDFATQ